mmetsp:Transcript_26987/g.77522  ORF Transcript_26987/g.77522 Transcript_26987/m.77522 type:complete len:301 (-) Transcript_26987:348-1250(-)
MTIVWNSSSCSPLTAIFCRPISCPQTPLSRLTDGFSRFWRLRRCQPCHRSSRVRLCGPGPASHAVHAAPPLPEHIRSKTERTDGSAFMSRRCTSTSDVGFHRRLLATQIHHPATSTRVSLGKTSSSPPSRCFGFVALPASCASDHACSCSKVLLACSRSVNTPRPGRHTMVAFLVWLHAGPHADTCHSVISTSLLKSLPRRSVSCMAGLREAVWRYGCVRARRVMMSLVSRKGPMWRVKHDSGSVTRGDTNKAGCSIMAVMRSHLALASWTAENIWNGSVLSLCVIMTLIALTRPNSTAR